LATGIAAFENVTTIDLVTQVKWRENVAELLVEVGRQLLARNDRQVVVAMGTALAYLEKADAQGDTQAAELLMSLKRAAHADRTDRFLFAPGELEEIKRRGSIGR
jgi:hypothetical protein